jgi:hypothetical protein
LSEDVFYALQSAVYTLVGEGGSVYADGFRAANDSTGGKVGDTSLVPLVFVTHLVEELSSKSPFIADIGCDRSVVEGMSSSLPSEKSP